MNLKQFQEKYPEIYQEIVTGFESQLSDKEAMIEELNSKVQGLSEQIEKLSSSTTAMDIGSKIVKLLQDENIVEKVEAPVEESETEKVISELRNEVQTLRNELQSERDQRNEQELKAHVQHILNTVPESKFYKDSLDLCKTIEMVNKIVDVRKKEFEDFRKHLSDQENQTIPQGKGTVFFGEDSKGHIGHGSNQEQDESQQILEAMAHTARI